MGLPLIMYDFSKVDDLDLLQEVYKNKDHISLKELVKSYKVMRGCSNCAYDPDDAIDWLENYLNGQPT